MSKNSLVEIKIEDLPALRDLFKIEWPRHVISVSLIDNCMRRFKKFPEHKENLKFYSLNGDWQHDGTFIFKSERQTVCDTLNSSLDRLKTALKLLDYTEMQFFMCFREIFRSMIQEIIEELNLKTIFNDTTKCLYISKNDAKQLEYEIPYDLHVQSLAKEHAIPINSIWPHRSPGSETFISYLIEFNPNVGLFNDSGQLIAWSLRLDIGSLGSLQVDENHLRKGYGSIVAKALTKKIANEFDEDITANIILKNFKSISMFTKLGYNEIDTNGWIGAIKNAE